MAVLAARSTATTVELHVLDQGPGMSAEDCTRAFDRFWRAASDNTGSGLGLAIVAQLARASGAAAELTPRPEGGIDASVRFTAP
jgi:signal transduction histidine kinase